MSFTVAGVVMYAAHHEGAVMAYPPKPRIRVSPALKAACLKDGRPFWQLTLLAGVTHPSRLSYLINADAVPATAINMHQLRRIAEVVGLPESELFPKETDR
jgi:hypothetical protein